VQIRLDTLMVKLIITNCFYYNFILSQNLVYSMTSSNKQVITCINIVYFVCQIARHNDLVSTWMGDHQGRLCAVNLQPGSVRWCGL